MKNKVKIYNARLIISLLLGLCVMLNTSLSTLAANLPCQSATVTGHYRHPETGIIEDSGGDANEALGQSMVSNVVDTSALVETTQDGTYLVSLRFHLMNNLTDIKLSVQNPGDSAWTSVSHERTATGDDTGDLRFEVASTDVIIRAQCMVDAMGRYVIFFITLDNFTEGNAGGFVQSEANGAEDGVTDSDAKEIDSDESDASQTESEEGVDGDLEGVDTDSETTNSGSSNSDSSQTTSGSNILDGVTGLTIGTTSNTATQTADTTTSIADNATPTASSVSGQEILPQELNISGQVWFMLFVLMLCANILGGLCVSGIRLLVEGSSKKSSKRARDSKDLDLEDSINNEEEPMPEDMEFEDFLLDEDLVEDLEDDKANF